MFKALKNWNKTKLQKEILKLLYQNMNALSVEINYYEMEKGEEALNVPDKAIIWAEAALKLNASIADQFYNNGHIEQDKMDLLLELNMKKRRDHDLGDLPLNYLGTFDDRNTPPRGWDTYFEEQLEDIASNV